MLNRKLFVLVAILATTLFFAGCVRSASEDPVPTAPPNQTEVARAVWQTLAAQPTQTALPTATAEPTATSLPVPTATVELASSSASTVVLLVEDSDTENGELKLAAEGTYLNWEDSRFRQPDGTYLVPLEYLEDLMPEAAVIIFEGEFYNTIGEHHVCSLILDRPNDNHCPLVEDIDEGYFLHINQGSFWGYTLDTTGWELDDLIQVFAWNKWQNGQTQTPIFEWPIFAHLSGATVSYATGEEPDLTEVQELYVAEAEEARCPAEAPALRETPYSDSSGGHAVVGAPGSYSCLTLFVGQLTADGDTVALYWLGARDLFNYWSEDAVFFLIPVGWGETEMQNFVSDEFGNIDVSPAN